MTGQRVSGVVKFFDQVKGWGFITVPGQPDVFVHRNDLGHLALSEDDKVTLELIDGKPGKGPKAANVEIA